MATSTDRQSSSYSVNEPGSRPSDARGPAVNINQTSTTPRSTGSSAGIFLMALLLLAGIIAAIYYMAGNNTTAPTVIQNNSSEVRPNPTPVTPPAQEPVTEAPALNNQSAAPAPLETAPAQPAPAPATPELAPAP